jgi:CRISPR/Cas system-associated exonuclease Cas4 (RecB family)
MSASDLIFPTATDERAQAIRAGLETVEVHRLSPTQISMYQRCGRQWAYRYVLGMRVAPDAGLIVGSGVHAAAESGMNHKLQTGENPDPEEAKTVAAEYVTEQIATGEVRMEADATPGGMADKAVRVAGAWAEEAAPHVTPLEVEGTFVAEISGIPVTGRIDVRTADHVVDWKTSGKSPTVSDVIASSQAGIYGAVTGLPVMFTYLVDQKRAVKVVDVPVEGQEAAQAARMATATVADVAEGMALGVWPRNRQGWHCSAKWCGFYERCHAGIDDAELRDHAVAAREAARNGQ